ncbi:MAG: septum formation protein Maf [Clostridia bacterium]|nr:septum formation protein Maf [Clostridia bacterium]
MKRLILASKSPRRDELLSLAGYAHEVLVSDADETVPEGTGVAEGAVEVSKRKARAVIGATDGERVVVAADTVVEACGEVFGKPKDARDAERMLRAMSGGKHFVHTGVTVTDGTRYLSEAVTTEVKMRELDESEIMGYIDSGEPFDKAGAYGIQGIAGTFVERLEGDYFNVVGLPLCTVSGMLKEFGVELFPDLAISERKNK